MGDETPRVLTAAPQPPALRNPWVAAVASLLLPGAGQALNGQFWKGTLLLVLSLVALCGIGLGYAYLGGGAAIAAGFVYCVVVLFSIVEAAREASRLNQQAQPFDSRRSAIKVTLLLLVVFPIVAFVSSCVTLLVLPVEVLEQIAQWTKPIADWAEPLRRAMGMPK